MSDLGDFSISITQLIWILSAYLLGSIAFGILASKLFGLPDPRTIGSGNIGATNVLRSGKKMAAVFTLIGDVLKGWLPVWLALQANLPIWLIAAVGLAVFFGHLYPIYYRFKGGKGVATALGIMLALSPLLGLAALLTWIAVFILSKISSLSALTAAALAPMFAWLLNLSPIYVATVLILSIWLIWRHQTNIQKLLAGTEAGFSKK
jgi:acyl phosphate:glycerol-3-phosphate acyltransferase